MKPNTDGALDKLAQLIGRFVAGGKRVYIILDIPISAAFDPHKLIQRKVLSPGFALKSTFRTRAVIENAIRPLNSKPVRVARDSGATIIDPINWLCSRTVCPAITPRGDPIYRDMLNLNSAYVRSAGSFVDVTLN